MERKKRIRERSERTLRASSAGRQKTSRKEPVRQEEEQVVRKRSQIEHSLFILTMSFEKNLTKEYKLEKFPISRLYINDKLGKWNERKNARKRSEILDQKVQLQVSTMKLFSYTRHKAVPPKTTLHLSDLHSNKRVEARPKPVEEPVENNFRRTKIAYNPEPVPIKGTVISKN